MRGPYLGTIGFTLQGWILHMIIWGHFGPLGSETTTVVVAPDCIPQKVTGEGHASVSLGF